MLRHTVLAAMLLLANAAIAQTAAPGTDEEAAATAPSGPSSGAPKSAVPAKQLFGAARTPAPLAARAIGFYAKGCLAGARALATDGPAWQAMRLSRNRNWGHPELVALIERFAVEAKRDGWPGLLVGDLSQPRGGPMLTGHMSHQVGLDADVWLTPMPDRRLTAEEREMMAAVSMLATGSLAVDPSVWTPAHVRLLRRAASYAEVERVLVHPAIKKALCEASTGDPDRRWLHKVRPVFGHYYHFHVRITCPKGSAGCQPQAPTAADDGCGKELQDWYALLTAPPKPATRSPQPPPPPITLADLPADCRSVLGELAPAETAKRQPRDTPPPANR